MYTMDFFSRSDYAEKKKQKQTKQFSGRFYYIIIYTVYRRTTAELYHEVKTFRKYTEKTWKNMCSTAESPTQCCYDTKLYLYILYMTLDNLWTVLYAVNVTKNRSKVDNLCSQNDAMKLTKPMYIFYHSVTCNFFLESKRKKLEHFLVHHRLNIDV